MNKRDTVEILRREGTFYVHLDPRALDVIVPPWLRHQDHLVLQFGDNMPIAIPDLRVDKDGVFGTLSFSRTAFTCSIPWHAVFAVVGDNGRGMTWERSMPASVLEQVQSEAKKLPWPSRTKSGLRAVPNCGSSKGPARRGHLRLVK